MTGLSKTELNALVTEAVIDAHNEDEALMGFADLIEDKLDTPFKTTVLGVTVAVEGVTRTSHGIVANCVRGEHRHWAG
jgi:hypothetical protein